MDARLIAPKVDRHAIGRPVVERGSSRSRGVMVSWGEEVISFSAVAQCITFPENAVIVSLDAGVRVRQFQTPLGQAAILAVPFDGDEAAAELLGDHRCRAAARKGIEHHVSRVRAGQDELRQKFLGLLRRVIRILGHGPEGHREIGPEVRGMRRAKAAPLGPLPILRVAVLVRVGAVTRRFSFTASTLNV